MTSQYLLNKLEKSKKIPSELFRYFDDNLRNKKKLNLKFKLHRSDDNLLSEIIEDNEDNTIVPIQEGRGDLNNIKIDENSLN